MVDRTLSDGALRSRRSCALKLVSRYFRRGRVHSLSHVENATQDTLAYTEPSAYCRQVAFIYYLLLVIGQQICYDSPHFYQCDSEIDFLPFVPIRIDDYPSLLHQRANVTFSLIEHGTIRTVLHVLPEVVLGYYGFALGARNMVRALHRSKGVSFTGRES